MVMKKKSKLDKKTTSVVVIGGGGHAKSVISVLKKIKSLTIIGYVDLQDKGNILGVKYLGTDSQLPKILKKRPSCGAVIGVGSIKISDKREKIIAMLASLGFRLPPIISPTSIINEDVSIGDGTVIMDGAIINSGTTLGQGVIINTGSLIDHDCYVGDFVHICPGVVLSGGVRVGKNSFLGIASTVSEYKNIGEGCLVGAGAVVTEDCLHPGVYLGIPARRKE